MILNRKSPYWIAMSVIRNLIILGARNEREIAALLKAGNINPSNINNAEMKVPLEATIAIVEALLQLSGDKNIGIHLGSKATPQTFGLVGHFQQSSSDVLTAFKKTVCFTRTFTTLYNLVYKENKEEIILYFEPVQLWNDIAPETARLGVDILFAATLNFIKNLSGQTVFPLRVLYRYTKVNETTEYEKIFQCKPLFNQSSNCISFNKVDLKLPILGYNPQLNSAIANMLHENLRQANEGICFTSKVKEIIASNIYDNYPQLDTIALALNITPRTLQRKLQEENTTYRELSDTIKFELATTLLKHKELNISQVAYKLGYADAGTFRKAFKQWSGDTPVEYRGSKLLVIKN